jgi:NAD(P)-dependent dehydrogenase (short-subunit alcohol dehydrogenase family)
MPNTPITGSNRVLGLALVRTALADGRKVLATVRPTEDVTTLCALAGDNQLSLHTMDLIGFDSIDRLAQNLDGTPIDILPSNGAITDAKSTAFGETGYAVWADLMRANAIAQMRPAEALAKNVAASDRNAIIFISSPIGPTPNFGYVNYRAVKSCCRLRLALKDGV